MTLPEPMLAWWNARESREQKLLLVGAVLIVVVGLYSLIQPVISMHRVAGEDFQSAEAEYHWFKAQIAALGRMRAKSGGTLPVNLPPLAIKQKLEGDLKKKSLKGKVTIKDDAGVKGIQVKLEGGDGRKVMRWIEELANGGYAISGLDFKNAGGRLSGTIMIEV